MSGVSEMPLTHTAAPVNFHISLNVASLDRSVAFFRTLFGQEPTKHRSDYAKFEVANPPLTLSLEPGAPGAGGALNHAGFRFAGSHDLVELQRRLEMAGISSQREEGVECCYAKQTKFWLHDPDRNLWEFYVLEGDIEHRGAGQSELALEGTQPAAKFGKPSAPVTCSTSPGSGNLPASATAPQSSGSGYTSGKTEAQRWAHRLGEPAALPTQLAAGSLDEVMLQGTFNGQIDQHQAASLLDDVFRALAEGGRLTIHCLTADCAVTGELQLPGPAAVVRNVPIDVELLALLADRGFQGVRLTRFGASPCFHVNGAQMRETMVVAYKPAACEGNLAVVVYRGPFREVTLDSGHVLRRGERTILPDAVFRTIDGSDGRDQFVRLASPGTVAACGG
jgi:catechol 2,3-dioxygenase-like lactoylglutathione lyase family enzyme